EYRRDGHSPASAPPLRFSGGRLVTIEIRSLALPCSNGIAPVRLTQSGPRAYSDRGWSARHPLREQGCVGFHCFRPVAGSPSLGLESVKPTACFAMHREVKLVNQGAKLLLPDSHEFAQLSDGQCHYRIDGLSTGRPLLLIHGATMSSWQF